MEVKIKLSDGAQLPQYAKEGDAGMDIIAISKKIVDEGQFGYIEYDTGISVEIPQGYVLDIRPRSSISNTGMILANSPGTLDSNYRGTIKCRFKAIPNTKHYDIGERVAQIILIPAPKMELNLVQELSETNRGEDGFGSTGK